MSDLDMKVVLRSLVNADGELSQHDLRRNFIYLSQSDFAFVEETDAEIWEYLKNYAVSYNELPTPDTLQDHFERTNNAPAYDRVDEITGVRKTYHASDFENLVNNQIKAVRNARLEVVLRTAFEILHQGKTIKKGRENVEYRDYRGAMRYVMESADDFLVSDRGGVTKSDIVTDADVVREEFRRVLAAEKQSWGCITGLRDIDRVCRGAKPGEMWTHAAFTGELKCLQGSSLIFNHATKKLEEIGALYNRDELPKVTSLYREGMEPRLVTAQASHLVENGVREVYTVKLKSGRELEITDNHPLWSAKGGGTWQELKDLEEGDYVGVPSVMRVPEPREDFSDAEVVCLGYLLGDGSIQDSILLTASNELIRDDFVAQLAKLGYREGFADYLTPSYRICFPEERSPYVSVSHSAGNGNSSMTSPLQKRLVQLGLWGRDAHTKFIPGELFGLPEDQVSLLVGALWSTDGSCHTGNHERKDRDSLSERNDITYASASKDLAIGVQMLLTRLGIQSTVRPVNTTYNDEPYRFYTVRVTTAPSKRRFCDLITVVGKEERFDVLKARLKDVDDRCYPTELIAHLEPLDRAKSHTGSWRYAGQAQSRPTITGDGLRMFSQLEPDLKKHLEGDVTWDQIESISYKCDEMTYDLSVPEHHSFVVNDVITHNTSFALNWAYRAAFLLQWNVYYLSLEMPVEQIRRIIYVMHSNHPKFKNQGYPRLSYREIRDGEDSEGNKLSQDKIDFYDTVIQDVKENQGVSYGSLIVRSPDEDVTVPKLRQDLEITHAQNPVHICFLDHFALMTPARRTGNYYTDLNTILRDAKRLALTFNHGEKIPIVGLLQMNRQGKADADKHDGKYRMQALADANEAERSSDVITYTYLDEERRNTGSPLFGCLKNRDNPHFDPFTANIEWGTKFLRNTNLQEVQGEQAIAMANGELPDIVED